MYSPIKVLHHVLLLRQLYPHPVNWLCFPVTQADEVFASLFPIGPKVSLFWVLAVIIWCVTAPVHFPLVHIFLNKRYCVITLLDRQTFFLLNDHYKDCSKGYCETSSRWQYSSSVGVWLLMFHLNCKFR